jgi:hypothetical protein
MQKNLRRLRIDMFNHSNRPFFQSSILYRLDRLPHEELERIIVEKSIRLPTGSRPISLWNSIRAGKSNGQII